MANLVFVNVKFDFRWIFGLGAIPAALLCALYLTLPDSQLDFIYEFDKPQEKYTDRDKQTGFYLFVALVKFNRKSVIIGVLLCFALQFTGQYHHLSFYHPKSIHTYHTQQVSVQSCIMHQVFSKMLDLLEKH